MQFQGFEHAAAKKVTWPRLCVYLEIGKETPASSESILLYCLFIFIHYKYLLLITYLFVVYSPAYPTWCWWRLCLGVTEMTLNVYAGLVRSPDICRPQDGAGLTQ